MYKKLFSKDEKEASELRDAIGNREESKEVIVHENRIQSGIVA